MFFPLYRYFVINIFMLTKFILCKIFTTAGSLPFPNVDVDCTPPSNPRIVCTLWLSTREDFVIDIVAAHPALPVLPNASKKLPSVVEDIIACNNREDIVLPIPGSPTLVDDPPAGDEAHAVSILPHV